MTFQSTFVAVVGSALLGLSCASTPAPSAESSGSPAPAAPAAPATPAAPAAPAAAGAPPAAAPAAPIPLKNLPGMTVTWNDLDTNARKEYMKKAVMPRMGDEFAGFDAKFNTFTCVTCHGSSAKKGDFKMPSAELPKLPKDPEAMKKLVAEKPTWMMFMADMVKPHMADLLGKKAFDMKTKTGNFGCDKCHVFQ